MFWEFLAVFLNTFVGEAERFLLTPLLLLQPSSCSLPEVVPATC